MANMNTRVVRLTTGLGWVMVLTMGYLLVQNHFLQETGLGGQAQSSATQLESNQITSGADVPDSVVQNITDSLNQGTSAWGESSIDELVVLPTTGGGYDVSATVDLGYGGSVTPTVFKDTTMQDMNTYFSRIYQSGEDVREAELYFMYNGQPVAGAGLGKTAYDNLSVQTQTNSEDLATAVTTSAPIINQNDEEEWYEIQENAAP